MNTRQLECFVEVGKTLSFSKAAQNLFLTQSSVTYQVTQLEQELGVMLLERNTRNVRLSVKGRQFLEDAQQLLQMMRSSVRNLNEAENAGKKRLVLLNHHTEEDGIYKPALIMYSREYPDVELVARNAEYEYTQLSPDVIVSTEVSSVLEEYCSPEHIWTLRKIRAYANMLSNHPLAGRNQLSVEDLKGYPLLVTKPSAFDLHDWDLWRYICLHKDEFDVLPNERISIMETNSRLYTTVHAIKITIGRRVNFEEEIVQIPFDHEMSSGLSLKIGITRGNESPQAQMLVDFLRERYHGTDDE